MQQKTRESKLICYSVPSSKGLSKIEQLLIEGVNWHKVLSERKFAPLLPILYFTLNRIPLTEHRTPILVPSEVLSELKQKYLQNKARNIMYLSELHKILETFAKQNIETIILKGISFLNTIYQDIGVREITDIDMLIHKEDLRAVDKLLRELGYSNDDKYSEANKTNHTTYFKGVILDIHWDIVNKSSAVQKYVFKLNIDELWQNTMPAQIASSQSLILTPEYLLIYLSFHLLKEAYHNIKWIADIYQLIEKYDIEWKKVISLVQRAKISKPVFYALYYAKSLFNANVPQFVLDELHSPHRIEQWIFRLPSRPLSLWRLIIYLASIESKIDKLKALAKLSLPRI
ncbi:MAG: nucleotidyltransferase family protein [Candidatus Stahlbacteria bacterium]|nr:nucleotidyltransferase family protein [Candidatus Stahlbacteria bacterium]